MTEKDIYEIIKQDNTPYWTLFVVTGYSKQHVGGFNLEGFNALQDEEKIQKSIEHLSHRLSLLRNETNFSIKLKKTPKSNQDGIFEYSFISSQGGNRQTLSGLNKENLSGYIPVSIYDKEREIYQNSLSGQMDSLRRENELRIKELLNEHEIKRKLDQLTQKEKEVKELGKKYISKKDLLSDTIGNIIDKTLSKWFGDNLAGINKQQEENNESDERLDEIEDFANQLYESQMSDEQVKLLILNVKNQLTQKDTTDNKESGGVNTGDSSESN